MKKIIKDRKITDDSWQVFPEVSGELPEGEAVLPLSVWNAQADALLQRSPVPGLFFASHEKAEDFQGDLNALQIIVVDFPVFTDGRGYSIATQLRSQFEYQGELRAQGEIHRDQLYMLARCGFNAFDFPEGTDLEDALSAFDDFSEDYQMSANQPKPLFLRR